MRALAPYFGSASLLALVAALGFAVSVQLGRPQGTLNAEIADPTVVETDGAGFTLPSARPAVFYDAITDRPLFSPERRPRTAEPMVEPEAPVVTEEPEVPEMAAAPSLEPPNLRLMGVMTIDGTAAALVQLSDAPAEWVKVGQSLGGWDLKDIGPDWITLTHEETETRVDMYR